KHTGDADEVRTDVEYIIRVQMESIPHAPGPDGGTLHALRLKMPDGKNAVVTVEECNYSGSDSDLYVRTWLISLMGSWLNKNLDQFSHTFATVNIGAKVTEGKFQWLQPTYTSYAVIDDTVSVATGILGVLCMTEDRAPSPDQIITRETIPDGERSSFLISKERFLSKMLIGGMGYMFSGPVKTNPMKKWPEDYFELTDNQTAITNTEDLRIDKMRVGDEDCACRVDARTMIVKLEETYLDVLFEDLRHPYYKPLGEYWLNIHHHFQTRNVARLNENQVFDLIPGSGSAELKVATHTAYAKKTKYAETVEWIVIFANVLTLLFPLARAGWLRFIAQDVEEAADGALQIADIVADGAVDEEAAADMAEEGAQAAQAMEEGGEATLGNWILGAMTSGRAVAIYIMTAALTVEEILAKMADKDAAKELPQYKEFAATVMEPVTWP
ncbi:TULIP family P47-like protein, partial [Escherichia coli]|nr:TULIP family P47-like protein [Escherichia coli]